MQSICISLQSIFDVSFSIFDLGGTSEENRVGMTNPHAKVCETGLCTNLALGQNGTEETTLFSEIVCFKNM